MHGPPCIVDNALVRTQRSLISKMLSAQTAVSRLSAFHRIPRRFATSMSIVTQVLKGLVQFDPPYWSAPLGQASRTPFFMFHKEIENIDHDEQSKECPPTRSGKPPPLRF